MAEMSMNKVIHGAVKRDLVRFEAALRDFTEGDTARAADLHRAWENFDWQLTHHHEGEHEIAWPALRAIGIAEDDIHRFDDDHEKLAAALGEAGQRMAALATSATRADADAAAAAMAKLTEVAASHFDDEEAVSESLYADHKDHPAIKEMGQKFGRAQSIKQSGVFFAWLQNGASPDEVAALKGSVPGFVLVILGFFGRSYKKEIAPIWS